MCACVSGHVGVCGVRCVCVCVCVCVVCLCAHVAKVSACVDQWSVACACLVCVCVVCGERE